MLWRVIAGPLTLRLYRRLQPATPQPQQPGERASETFVIRRRDGQSSPYQLAVVMDDVAQGVTDIVRRRRHLLELAHPGNWAAVNDLLRAPDRRVILANIPLVVRQQGEKPASAGVQLRWNVATRKRYAFTALVALQSTTTADVARGASMPPRNWTGRRALESAAPACVQEIRQGQLNPNMSSGSSLALGKPLSG